MVTTTARHMVCDWGMTKLGPIAYGESQSHAYMGTVAAGAKNYSEETAQKIDQMIHSIVQEQYERSLQILNEHRSALDTMAAALLEHETIEGTHVSEILEFGEIRSPVTKRSLTEVEPQADADQEASTPPPVKEDDDHGNLAGDETPAPSPA